MSDIPCARCGEPWSFRGMHWTSSDLNWLAAWDLFVGRGCPCCGGTVSLKGHTAMERKWQLPNEGVDLYKEHARPDPNLEPTDNNHFELDWLVLTAIETRRELALDPETVEVCDTIKAALSFPKKNAARYRRAMAIFGEDPERPGRLAKGLMAADLTIVTDMKPPEDPSHGATQLDEVNFEADARWWKEWLQAKPPCIQQIVKIRPDPDNGADKVCVDLASFAFFDTADSACKPPEPVWQEIYGFQMRPSIPASRMPDVVSHINNALCLVDEINEIELEGIYKQEGYAEIVDELEQKAAQENYPEAVKDLLARLDTLHGIDLSMLEVTPENFDFASKEGDALLEVQHDDRTQWQQPEDKKLTELAAALITPIGWHFWKARNAEMYLAIPAGCREPCAPDSDNCVAGVPFWKSARKDDDGNLIYESWNKFPVTDFVDISNPQSAGYNGWRDLPSWVQIDFLEWAKEED